MGVVKGLLFGALLWLLWSKVGVAALVAVPLVMFFLLWWQQDSLLYMPRQGGYRVRPEHVLHVVLAVRRLVGFVAKPWAPGVKRRRGGLESWDGIGPCG